MREANRLHPPLLTPVIALVNTYKTVLLQKIILPTLRSFSTLILTRSAFVRPWSLSFTAKKPKIEATTIAALDDNPEPAGTEPVTRISIPLGIL